MIFGTFKWELVFSGHPEESINRLDFKQGSNGTYVGIVEKTAEPFIDTVLLIHSQVGRTAAV